MSRLQAAVSRRIPTGARRTVRTGLVRYRHAGLRRDDLLFVSFPKSGSTWLRFVLAQALTGEPMDFDRVREVSPPLGRHRGGIATLAGGGRLVKSHELPRFVGPARPKILYLVRDGRDVAVSYRTHLQRRGFRTAELDEFVTRFAAGGVGAYGSWHDHVAAWTRAMAASSASSAVVRYEDLLADPVPTLLAASGTLGLGLSETAVRDAFAANTPDAMREKESSSKYIAASTVEKKIAFVGTATAGGWRATLPAETVAAFEARAGRQLTTQGYELASPVSRPGS